MNHRQMKSGLFLIKPSLFNRWNFCLFHPFLLEVTIDYSKTIIHCCKSKLRFSYYKVWVIIMKVYCQFFEKGLTTAEFKGKRGIVWANGLPLAYAIKTNALRKDQKLLNRSRVNDGFRINRGISSAPVKRG